MLRVIPRVVAAARIPLFFVMYGSVAARSGGMFSSAGSRGVAAACESCANERPPMPGCLATSLPHKTSVPRGASTPRPAKLDSPARAVRQLLIFIMSADLRSPLS